MAFLDNISKKLTEVGQAVKEKSGELIEKSSELIEVNKLKYIIGYVVSLNILNRLEENPSYIYDYLNYLSTHNENLSINEALLILNIDLYSSETYDIAFNEIEKMITK